MKTTWPNCKLPLIRVVLLVIVSLPGLPRCAGAQTTLMNSGNWDVPSNWTAGLPASSVDTAIDGGLKVSAPVGVSGTANNLYVGNVGMGALDINGGTLSFSQGYLGYNAGSNGTATVTSGTWNTWGSLTSNAGPLYVGYSGTGILDISGGTVTGWDACLGCNAGSNGTATITGGSWRAHENLWVGFSGMGALNINGGSVMNEYGFIGGPGGSGTVNVTGGLWDSGNDFRVGVSGTGALNLNGGTVHIGPGWLGDRAGSNGTANVSSGTLAASVLHVGNSGRGTLNLNGSGIVSLVNNGFGVSYVNPLFLAEQAGSTGTLNLGDGGTAGTLIASSVVGCSGTATVNFNHTGTYTFAPSLTGTLSVNKLGNGTTILIGTNDYAGATTVLSGRLALGSQGSLPNFTNINLSAGAVFDTTALSIGTFQMQGGQHFTFTLDPKGSGSAGLLDASVLDITNAFVDFATLGPLDDAAYVIADYTSLRGNSFASVSNLPNGYAIAYGFDNGTKIAVVGVPEPNVFVLLGLGAAGLVLMRPKCSGTCRARKW